MLLAKIRSEDEPSDLESLQEWMAEVSELRGLITAVEQPPPPGALGPLVEALMVALGPGGAATAFAAALISWIRHRSGVVTIRIDLPDGGRLELDAHRIRGLGATELQAEIDALLKVIRQSSAGGVEVARSDDH